MIKQGDKIFRIAILLIGIVVIGFDIELYNAFEQQKATLSSVKDKQDVESEFNSNKFKYQSDQIERMNKDLEDARQQIKDQKEALSDQKDELAAQKDALLQEVEKRQQVANESKNVQTSLVDIKAEVDAIKQDVKGWQKDYVSVLAELEKKMNDSNNEIKNVQDTLDSFNIPELKKNISSMRSDIENIAHPSLSASSTEPAPEKKSDSPAGSV